MCRQILRTTEVLFTILRCGPSMSGAAELETCLEDANFMPWRAQMKCNAVYPEHALISSISKHLSARLRGNPYCDAFSEQFRR